MTTTERNLLIAEAMKLDYVTDNSKIGLIDKDGWTLGIWNPSKNAEQREMIEDWLVKQKITFKLVYDANMNDYGCVLLATNIDILPINVISKVSLSEAFLQAVEQLIDNLKK